MLEFLYEHIDIRADAKSVNDFRTRFVSDAVEDDFYKAIRDTRYSGFREGVKTAIQLLTEIIEANG